MQKEQVVLRLTLHQAWRLRLLGERLWPGEDVGLAEISRRLLLEHLLWAESEGAREEQEPAFRMRSSQP